MAVVSAQNLRGPVEGASARPLGLGWVVGACLLACMIDTRRKRRLTQLKDRACCPITYTDAAAAGDKKVEGGGDFKHFLPIKDAGKIPRVDYEYHDALKATWEGLKVHWLADVWDSVRL